MAEEKKQDQTVNAVMQIYKLKPIWMRDNIQKLTFTKERKEAIVKWEETKFTKEEFIKKANELKDKNGDGISAAYAEVIFTIIYTGMDEDKKKR